MLSEQDELAAEIVERWVETHKKSMTMFVVLVALSSQPMWSRELDQWLRKNLNFELTERGLHRTLQRMTNLDLIAYTKDRSPKSGADRKVYRITEFGTRIARSIKDSGLSYLQNEAFSKSLRNL